MKGCTRATLDAAVAVVTFFVAYVVEAFGDHTILHCEILVAVKGGGFVDRPAKGAVVQNDVFFAPASGCVRVFLNGTQTESHVANYDLICIY